MQLENEFAREQMAESERTLRANLHGLRERNIECEDLKVELSRLQWVLYSCLDELSLRTEITAVQFYSSVPAARVKCKHIRGFFLFFFFSPSNNRLQNRSFEEELERTRSSANATQLGLREKLAQAVTDITLLHHSLRGLTNELHASLSEQVTHQSCCVTSEQPLILFRCAPIGCLRPFYCRLSRSTKCQKQFLQQKLQFFKKKNFLLHSFRKPRPWRTKMLWCFWVWSATLPAPLLTASWSH